MKCLLCGFAAEKNDLIKHYVNFHNVAPQNYIFKYLFLTNNEPLCIEYCRCNQFTTTKEYQRIHNFLEHYSDGKKLPFEEKPIEIKNIHGLTTYEISFEKHADYYNFPILMFQLSVDFLFKTFNNLLQIIQLLL